MNLLMTLSSIVIVALACGLIAGRVVSAPFRPAVATAVFLGAWSLSCVLDSHHPSMWSVLGSSLAITASLGAVIVALQQVTADSGAHDDHDDGGGGTTPTPPARPSGGPGGDWPEPDWWPDFERGFDAYVQQRRHGDERRSGLPAAD